MEQQITRLEAPEAQMVRRFLESEAVRAHAYRPAYQALFSYRARVLLGEFDMADPDANTQIVGLKALSPKHAWEAAYHVTGLPVLEIWRQDMASFPLAVPTGAGLQFDSDVEAFAGAGPRHPDDGFIPVRWLRTQ